jgi:RNA polymerase sigma factor (sigma-70 family)
MPPRKIKTFGDEHLWDAYWADRSDTNRNAIFMHHWPWIRWYIAVQLKSKRAYRVDNYSRAISICGAKALKAIPSYDPERGASFRTFLEATIQYGVLDTLRHGDPLGRSLRSLRNVVLDAEKDLTASLGKIPNQSELARHVRRSHRDIHSATHPTAALQEDACARGCDIFDRDNMYPSHHRKSFKDEFLWLTQGLSKRSRCVLWLRYIHGATIQDIADRYAVSVEAVEQSLHQIIAHVRKNRKPADAWADI